MVFSENVCNSRIIIFFFQSIFVCHRGTLYRPEKPPMFDDDNTIRSKDDFNFSSRHHTTAPQQSRPILPVPIVYH